MSKDVAVFPPKTFRCNLPNLRRNQIYLATKVVVFELS